MGLIIYIDGGARGNPGPAGAGVVIRTQDGQRVFEAAYFLGRQTNNAAEYHALIRALDRVVQSEPQPITVYSDSELLVRQITGEYRVKSPKLTQLYQQVQLRLITIARWSLRHVKREQNHRADELANLAMDRRENVVVFDVEQGASAAPATASAAPQAPAETDAAGPSVTALSPTVRVTVARAPRAGKCPAGGLSQESFTVDKTLPAGLCVYAAHAILPSLIAVLNTDPQEFAAVPTLTVRCGRSGCGAEFQITPVGSSNGKPRPGG